MADSAQWDLLAELAETSSAAKPVADRTEYGDTGMGYWGFVDPGTERRIRDLEYLADLRGMRAFPIYDRMRLSDPKIAGLRAATDLPLLRARPSIVPSDPKSPKAREVAQFVQECLFERMAYSWRSFLKEALLYRDYGFSPFEIIWCVDDDGKIRIDRLAWRPPSTIWWIWGANGRITKVEQSVFGHWLTIPGETAKLDGPKKTIDGSKLLWFVNQREGENWRGRSVLRPLHKPWYMKERLEIARVLLADKMGGMPVFTLGPSAYANATVKQEVDAMGRAWSVGERMFIRLPADVTMELLKSEASVADLDNSILQLEQTMSNVLIAQVLDLGKTGSGSRALGMTLGDMFRESCEAEAAYVEDELNRRESLIWQLVSYNFGEDPDLMPKLDFGQIGRVDPLEFGQGLNFLTQAGLRFDDPDTVAHIRELLDLPKLADDDIDEGAQNQTITPQPGQIAGTAGGQTIAQQTQAARDATAIETHPDTSKPASPIASPMLPGQRPPVLKAAERKLKREPRGLELFCDLAEVTQKFDSAKTAIATATDATRQAMVAELGRRARQAVDSNTLDKFAAGAPPMVDVLTRDIKGVLTSFYAAGRQQVADELQRQKRGSDAIEQVMDARRGIEAAESGSFGARAVGIAQAAAAAAKQMAQQIMAAAGAQAARVASGVPLDELAFDTAVGRAADAAANAQAPTVSDIMQSGRTDEAQAERSDIAGAVYSAILDQNTCDECEAADGTEYGPDELDEAFDATPNPDCAGGGFCRCLTLYELSQGA